MMKKLAGLVIALFTVAAAGQVFAGASVKYCIKHFNSKGYEYTVQHANSAAQHCTYHTTADNPNRAGNDKQVETECCETNATNLQETPVTGCGTASDNCGGGGL